jgi:hypothetical protein
MTPQTIQRNQSKGYYTTEVWEILVSLSASEISLAEAHDLIMAMIDNLPNDCISKNKVCEFPMNSCEHCKTVK